MLTVCFSSVWMVWNLLNHEKAVNVWSMLSITETDSLEPEGCCPFFYKKRIDLIEPLCLFVK